MIEIRWHGRGGQGAKTASLLLADAAFNTGKFIQGFPEYGPERMGAPITAYNRIDDKEIRLHSNVYTPDFVVVVDDTLLDSIDVTKGLKDNGGILINTSLDMTNIKNKINGYKGKVYLLDATKISIECLKSNFPNTALLSAVIKITNIMTFDTLLKDMEDSLKHKFSRKPEVIAPNIECLKRGYKEVVGG